MKTALSIRLHGEMPGAKLEEMRRRLGLEPKGRLTDSEDALFGYRYLRHDEGNRIVLDLYRRTDTDWVVTLTYLNEPPTDGAVEQYRSQIRDTAAALGLAVEEA